MESGREASLKTEEMYWLEKKPEVIGNSDEDHVKMETEIGAVLQAEEHSLHDTRLPFTFSFACLVFGRNVCSFTVRDGTIICSYLFLGLLKLLY